MRRPTGEPDGQRGVEPARQQQHWPRSGKAERGGFSRRQRDAVHRQPALAAPWYARWCRCGPSRCRRSRQWRRSIGPPARRRDRRRHRPAAPCRAPFDIAATSRAAAITMPLPRNGSTRTRGSRTVMREIPTAAKAARSVRRRRSPARRSGTAGSPVAARRQHAVARIDGYERFGVAIDDLHRVERRHAVGVGWPAAARLPMRCGGCRSCTGA